MLHEDGEEETLERVLDEIPRWAEKIDAFGRGSSETFLKLNVEIARIEDVLASQQAVATRVMATICSVIYIVFQTFTIQDFHRMLANSTIV